MTRRPMGKDMRHASRIAGLLAIASVAGCGAGKAHQDAARRVHRPALVADASPAQRAVLTQVVADFIGAYERGDAGALCQMLAAPARAHVIGRLHATYPELRGTSCAATIMAAYDDPDDQPPAVDEASAFVFRRITVQQRTATITFPDGE